MVSPCCLHALAAPVHHRDMARTDTRRLVQRVGELTRALVFGTLDVILAFLSLGPCHGRLLTTRHAKPVKMSPTHGRHNAPLLETGRSRLQELRCPQGSRKLLLADKEIWTCAVTREAYDSRRFPIPTSGPPLTEAMHALTQLTAARVSCRRLQNSKHPGRRLADDFHGFVGQVARSDHRTASRFGLADIFVEVRRQLRAQVPPSMDQRAFCRWSSANPTCFSSM